MVDFVKQYTHTRLNNKDVFIKRVVGNTFDMFSGEGWESWSRVLFVKARPEVRVMGGKDLPYLLRKKAALLIRGHFYG